MARMNVRSHKHSTLWRVSDALIITYLFYNRLDQSKFHLLVLDISMSTSNAFTVECWPFFRFLVPASTNPFLSKRHQMSISFHSIQRWSITLQNPSFDLFVGDRCQSHSQNMHYIHLYHRPTDVQLITRFSRVIPLDRVSLSSSV